MDLLIIFGAKYLVIIPALVVLTVLYMLPAHDRVRFTMLALLSLPLAYVLAKVAGHIYFNPRPFVVGNFTPLVQHGVDNGFPSDHTLLASSLAALMTVIRPRIGAILWVIAIVVGISRVLAGVHHTLDIVGAMVIAVIAVYTAFSLLRLRLRFLRSS
jgi:undecaprenyl-diphosphatase